jgi:Lipocalin-like domain
MKWMKWIGVLAVMVAVGLAASGCGGSDGGGGGLEGTWKATSFNGLPLPSDVALTVTLSGNGTYTGYITDGGLTATETGTWSASDTVLTTVLDGDVENVNYTLSGNTLILSDPEEGVFIMTRQ